MKLARNERQRCGGKWLWIDAETAASVNIVGSALRSSNVSEAVMYRTILLAYDGSLEGRLALREGARLAQTCGARVVLLAVVEHEPELFVGDGSAVYTTPDRTDAVQTILDEGFARLVRMGFSPEARLERGEPAERITTVAQEITADLVVVGHHKQGAMARWLLGSVTASLSDSLNCSLLVARLEVSDEELFRGPER